MIFYTYKYELKANKEKAFKYFLKKSYLIKYFSKKEKEDTRIISNNSNEIIIEGEEIKLLTNEIRNNELIKYRMLFKSIEEGLLI